LTASLPDGAGFAAISTGGAGVLCTSAFAGKGGGAAGASFVFSMTGGVSGSFALSDFSSGSGFASGNGSDSFSASPT
jgi:hypothetical protein